MGQVLQFAWPFTQNLMPSTVEPPRTNAIPTSGLNKITKHANLCTMLAEMPTSGDLKSGDSLFITSPPPPQPPLEI